MTETKQTAKLGRLAQRACRKLESAFPLWTTRLNVGDGELELAIPAPTGSSAGHLVAWSEKNQLWIRFSPPYMCYPADNEKELVSLIRNLISDRIVFKVVMKGEDWIETTRTTPDEEPHRLPGCFVRLVSWSGRFDRSC